MNSLQLENQWLRDRSDDAYGACLLISVWNLLEKVWFLKNALKKEIFSTKIFDTLCWIVHDGPDGWPPISPSHPKTRHLWSTKWLSKPPTWPILCRQYTTRAVCLTKCRFKLPSPNLPSSGLVGFYVRQVVCVCFYSLCKNMHCTCSVEYTARYVCPASRLAPTFPGP